MRWLNVLFVVGLLFLTSACELQNSLELPTPIPAEQLPTAIALTLAANRTELPGTPTPSATLPAPSPTSTQEVLPTAEGGLPATTYALEGVEPPSPTPPPNIGDAPIQIYRLGDQSRVLSPLRISGYLSDGSVGPLLLELHGEDGRILVRQVKTYEANPFNSTSFSFELQFEIGGPAEAGRLVLSTLDEFGRIKALNSVNLILLSLGENDIYPATALYDSLLIREPTHKTLIVGKKLQVSGLALTYSDHPLMAELISEEGKILGTRQLKLSEPDSNGYREYRGEVPFSVSELTSARLIVYEDGLMMSDKAHLASVVILLNP